MKAEIKGVFFDLDGVVIDSSPLWSYIIETIVDRYDLNTDLLRENDGYNLSTEDAIKMILEYSNRFSSTFYSEIIEYVEHLYTLHFKAKTALIKDIIDVFEWLTNRNIKLALVSNSSQRQVDTILKYYKLDKYFKDIITSDDVKYGKPHKEPYIKALQQSGFCQNEVLIIEDSFTGVASAQNAGLNYIMINDNIIDNKNITLLEYIKLQFKVVFE